MHAVQCKYVIISVLLFIDDLFQPDRNFHLANPKNPLPVAGHVIEILFINHSK